MSGTNRNEVRLDGVSAGFGPTPSIRAIDLVVERGEQVAIVGPSGVGTSTLLSVIGGLLEPSAGEVRVEGVDLFAMSERERSEFRCAHIGFVFQFGNLLSELTLAENVAIPRRLAGATRRESSRAAAELLEELGIGPLATRLPSEVSGGESQRATIARALINGPTLLLADEPTGSLDPENKRHVLDLLLDAAGARGATVMIVTHDLDVVERVERTCELRSGRVTDSASSIA